jgi:hypothetical protein
MISANSASVNFSALRGVLHFAQIGAPTIKVHNSLMP